MFTLETIQIPVISPIISLIIFFGLCNLGQLIIEFLKIEKIISSVTSLKFQYPMIGIIFVTFFIFPFAQLSLFSKYLIYFFSYSLILLGIYFIYNNFNKFQISSFKTSKEYILIIIITCYLLISLGLITDADSLDYHMGVPLYILNYEQYPNEKFWMHLTKSGSGEIFYTIGLINHAMQLPGLTQIAGILSITGLFLKKISFKNNYDSYHLALIAISCPVLIFFVSSAKVQLIYVASSTLIFTTIFFSKSNLLKNTNIIIFFNILLVTAISAKFSFALSSSILWFSILFISYKNKLSIKYIFFSVIIFSYILIPRSIYRIDLYEFDLISSFLNPLPTHLYGYKQLYESLTSCGYNGCFPYWLIFPKSLGSLTETLGIGSVAILLIKFSKSKTFLAILAIIIVQIVLSFIFGPNNARWYIEPFMWSLIAVKFLGFNNNIVKNIFFNLGLIQSSIIILPLTFAIYSLTPGSFSTHYSDKILSKNADGYQLYKWVNKNQNKEDVLISTHRSFSLGNYKVIPGDLFLYTNVNNEKNIIYYEELKKLKPNLILFYDKKKNFDYLKKCIGNLVFYKKNVGVKASRNPFNRIDRRFDGYIYEFNYDKLPNCALK
tara:strand:+ start:359 stop:2179 length:1821 start_codon:yes stop_codon:yes gene_type:complete